MTVREKMVIKVQEIPESLLQEVSDFIDFISMKQIQSQEERWNHDRENHILAESDLSTYLHDLEKYEERLSRRKIQW